MLRTIDDPVGQAIQIKNRILLALPVEDCQRILPKLELVDLARGAILHDAGDSIQHAFFINTGLASLIARTGSGASVEIGLVADEGLIGMPSVLARKRVSCRALVQIPGTALKIALEALEGELEQCPRLRSLLLNYMHVLHSQVSQSALCNRFHSLQQRMCRRFLTTFDRAGTDRFFLTHEMLARMLGSTRTPVTLIAGALQEAGLISYHRGQVRLLNQESLESSACECYRIIKGDFEHLFDA
jgi:CRP-like cAMP-binding protein